MSAGRVEGLAGQIELARKLRCAQCVLSGLPASRMSREELDRHIAEDCPIFARWREGGGR